LPRIRAGSIAVHKQVACTAILEAAKKVFLAKGYSEGPLAAIADVCGLPRTTIYDYFPSKGQILMAALADRVPPLIERLLDQRRHRPRKLSTRSSTEPSSSLFALPSSPS
jgi:AcrR family transcriptional regulator